MIHFNKIIKEIAQRRFSGQILIIAFLMIVVLLIAVVSFVALSLSEFRKGQGYADSMSAYYAAEAGVEKAILEIRDDNNKIGDNWYTNSGSFSTDSSYSYQISGAEEKMGPFLSYIIQTVTSIGEKNDVKRALKVQIKSAKWVEDQYGNIEKNPPDVFWPSSWVEINPYLEDL